MGQQADRDEAQLQREPAGRPGVQASPHSAFVLANEAYRKAFAAKDAAEHERLLKEAAAGYRSVLDVYSSSHAWHNLGNAMFRLGETGKSIAAYRASLLLAGSVPDTSSNLDYVRTQVTGAPEPPEPGAVSKALLFWYYGASLRTLEVTAVVLWAAVWILAGLWLWRRGGSILSASAVCLVLAVVFGAGYLQRSGELESPSVVVTSRDTNVLSEARPKATPLFALPEGSEVRMGRTRSSESAAGGGPAWIEVVIPKGAGGPDAERTRTAGWVPAEDIVGFSAEEPAVEGQPGASVPSSRHPVLGAVKRTSVHR